MFETFQIRIPWTWPQLGLKSYRNHMVLTYSFSSCKKLQQILPRRISSRTNSRPWKGPEAWAKFMRIIYLPSKKQRQTSIPDPRGRCVLICMHWEEPNVFYRRDGLVYVFVMLASSNQSGQKSLWLSWASRLLFNVGCMPCPCLTPFALIMYFRFVWLLPWFGYVWIFTVQTKRHAALFALA